MKNLLKVMLEGAFTNFKRIVFASERVTDMDIRSSILEGRVKATEKVAKVSCIGCGGCANVCPTNAIDMKALDNPILITEEWVKKELPVLNSEKCVFCYHCHDFCPTYALFGEKATIHPNDVGEVNLDMAKLIKTPIKISDDKIAIIAQFLADKTILKKEDIDNINTISKTDESNNKVVSNEMNDDEIYADVIEIRDNNTAKIKKEKNKSESEDIANSTDDNSDKSELDYPEDEINNKEYNNNEN